MKRLLTILTFGLFLLSLAAEDVVLFENRADRPPQKEWRLSYPESLSLTQTPWPDGTSGLAMKLTYKPCPNGWPSVKLFMPEDLRDWSKAKTITLQVYCETQQKIYLNIATYTDPKTKHLHPGDGMRYEPGMHTIVLDLAVVNDMDLTNVKYIDIFADRPAINYSLYVGDITLQVQSAEELAANRAAALQEVARGFQWREASLNHQIPAIAKTLQASLAFLSRKAPAALTDAQISSLQNAVEELFPRMDQEIFQRNAALHNGLGALWCAPEEKVLREDYAFYDAPTPEYTLDAARGEGESAQLVAYATEPLQAVSVKVLQLPALEDGTTLPADAITLSPVGYVTITDPAYAVKHLGYWPDPILEYLQNPVAMEKDRYQSWWMDLQIPADQKPGLYQGTVQVSAEGERDILMPFAVRVHEFALTQGVPYFSPCCILYENEIHKAIPDSRPYWEKIASMLIQHRVDPAEIYFFMNRSWIVENAKWLLDHGATSFNMGFVNREVDDAFAAQITDAYNRCKEAGILDKAYIYCYDEQPPEKFEMIKRSLARVRELAPNIPIYTTLYDGTFGAHNGLDEVIDGWIPLNTSYEKNAEYIPQARARGDKVCWYVCCGPTSPYANLLLDQPAAGHRLLMGFMAKKYKTDGFLYYRACGMTQYTQLPNGGYKESYITTPVDGDSTLLAEPWKGESFRKYPGDGRLIYIGKDAPLPTQRLKNMRDGMDDWMYLDLLEKALQNSANMPEEWKASAAQELQIEESLVTNLAIWSREPAPIQAKKLRIAALLDQYAQQNP